MLFSLRTYILWAYAGPPARASTTSRSSSSWIKAAATATTCRRIDSRFDSSLYNRCKREVPLNCDVQISVSYWHACRQCIFPTRNESQMYQAPKRVLLLRCLRNFARLFTLMRYVKWKWPPCTLSRVKSRHLLVTIFNTQNQNVVCPWIMKMFLIRHTLNIISYYCIRSIFPLFWIAKPSIGSLVFLDLGSTFSSTTCATFSPPLFFQSTLGTR